MTRAVTCGTFDYKIHEGHLMFLGMCRMLCDELWVAVVGDWVVNKNKHRRPFYSAPRRAENLMATGLVDGTFIFDNVLELLNFDLYILGKDQSRNPWNEHTLIPKMMEAGIPVMSTLGTPVASTTRMLAEAGWLDCLMIT